MAGQAGVIFSATGMGRRRKLEGGNHIMRATYVRMLEVENRGGV